MKNLAFVFALLLLGQLSFAQASQECNGIKLTVLSVTESTIQVQVDATAYGKQLNPPGGAVAAFTLENGTCQGCQPVGGRFGNVGTWTIQNQAGPTSLTWTRFMGTCDGQSFIIDQPSTTCAGIELTVLSVTNSQIQVEVDATNYNHQLNPPGAAYAGFTLENGQCQGCQPAGGNRNDVEVWNIQNQAGSTKLIFSSFTGGVCNGQQFVID
ncbi:MAG: hypothetical protein AAFZ63_04085 [Bacteroidota bacterium]